MQDTTDAALPRPATEILLRRENEEMRAEVARLHLLLAQADLEAERRAREAADEALRRQTGELDELRARLTAAEAARASVLASSGAIARSSERLRAVLESASDHAIIATDLAGRITLWSRGAEAVLGWPASEALGRDASMIFLPEDRAAGVPREEMVAALATGRAQDERWHQRRDGTRIWARGGLVPLRGAEGTAREGRTTGYLKILRDRTQEKRAEEQARLLGDELQHRVKNTLALVQAIVRQSLRGAASPSDALGIIDARLAAMGRAHESLTRGGWTGADLGEAVRDVLRPHDDGVPGRFSLRGPPVALPPQAAMHLALVLHELATNAAKYGALSVPSGHVSVEWAVEDAATAPAEAGGGGTDRRGFRLTWQEHDGPPVLPPARRGFGSRLIERGLASVFGGRAALSYAHDGVRCEVEGTLAAFVPGAAAGGAAAGDGTGA